jgi:hypothetical protein
MPKFYVAKHEGRDKIVAEGSLDATKKSLRDIGVGKAQVKVYDFAFTKESICTYTIGDMKPVEEFTLAVNASGQCRTE